MKNHKNLFFILASIATLGSSSMHIDKKNISQKFDYLGHLKKLEQNLANIPEQDIKVITCAVKKKLEKFTTGQLEKLALNDNWVDQIVRGEIIYQVEQKNRSAAQIVFYGPEVEDSIEMIINEATINLVQSKDFNNFKFSLFFNPQELECCICFENSRLRVIPCYNKEDRQSHSDWICFGCSIQISCCPICRGSIRKAKKSFLESTIRFLLGFAG